jgi:hypothetical protein
MDYDEETPLENDWIIDFEKIDNEYKDFYNEDLHFLKIHSIYINVQNEIEKIKEEKIFISSNKISRDNLLGILKHNSFNGEKRYSILSILKYNIDMHSNDVKNFVLSKEQGLSDSFISIIKNIDDIVFNQTINMFQDLNDVIILFYEKTLEEQKNQGIQRTHSRRGSLTKKVYINSNYGPKHKSTYKYMKTI